jgi:hypothetical protein
MIDQLGVVVVLLDRDDRTFGPLQHDWVTPEIYSDVS